MWDICVWQNVHKLNAPHKRKQKLRRQRVVLWNQNFSKRCSPPQNHKLGLKTWHHEGYKVSLFEGKINRLVVVQSCEINSFSCYGLLMAKRIFFQFAELFCGSAKFVVVNLANNGENFFHPRHTHFIQAKRFKLYYFSDFIDFSIVEFMIYLFFPLGLLISDSFVFKSLALFRASSCFWSRAVQIVWIL